MNSCVVPHQGQLQFLLGLSSSQGNKENVEPVTNMGNFWKLVGYGKDGRTSEGELTHLMI